MRKKFWKIVEQSLARQRQEFYNTQATTVQKFYRGYYSRKYIHDFSARMTYMEHIAAKNAQLRDSLSKYNEELQEYDIRMAEENERREFTLLSNKLHYLTSTRAVPGVFKELEAVSDFGKTS